MPRTVTYANVPAGALVNLDLLNHLDPDQLRSVLPGFVSAYIGQPAAAAANKARLQKLTAGWSDAEARATIEHLASLGEEHRVYPADPSCQKLARTWCEDVFTEIDVRGAEHLAEAARRGPVVVVSNHLSYIDSTAIDAALCRAGHTDLADRLISIAGPKVYTDLFRRVASGSLSTLPVPQSTSLGHTEQLSVRDLARRARTALNAANDALHNGSILLLYAEGSRTRTGRMQPFLKGAHRYLAAEGLTIVPMGLVGTQHVMPVEESLLSPGPLSLTFGPGIQRATSSRDVLAQLHGLVAALLPESQRPLESEPALR